MRIGLFLTRMGAGVAFVSALLFLFFLEPGLAADWESPGGDGSYAVTVPADGSDTHGNAVKTEIPDVGPNLNSSIQRKAPTHEWCSPLVWLDPAFLPDPTGLPEWQQSLTWWVFSDPLIINPQKGGLMISYNLPDSQRAAMVDGKLTAGAGFRQVVTSDQGDSPYYNGFNSSDLYAGSTETSDCTACFNQVQVQDFSDWFVKFDMTAGQPINETMTVTAGNGSPIVLVKLSTGKPLVRFNSWVTATTVSMQGDVSADIARGVAQTGKDMQGDALVFDRGFAVINKQAFPKPDEPTDAAAYDIYTIWAVFGPKGSQWSFVDSGSNPPTAVCNQGDYYATVLLPFAYPKGIYDEPDTELVHKVLSFFSDYVFNEVADTEVIPVFESRHDKEDVRVEYKFTTTQLEEGTGLSGAVTALYPHHYINQPEVKVIDQDLKPIVPEKPDNLLWWPTLKGAMLMGAGEGFTNLLDVPSCLPAVVSEASKADRTATIKYITEAFNSPNPEFINQDSYFGGQTMNRFATLLPIAEQLEEQGEDTAGLRKKIYEWLTEKLGDRLTAVTSDGSFKNAAQHLFYYDDRWGAMIPSESAFDSGRILNDHHFHYGYWIRTATEIARYEKDMGLSNPWSANYYQMVKMLIKDIADFERTPQAGKAGFPFLRYFSPYVGHSWARGTCDANVGGDQESSSEAINAWSACLLWAELNYPKDDAFNNKLKTWAAYMLASEVRAAQLYWFGHVDNLNFQDLTGFSQYNTKSSEVPLPYGPHILTTVAQAKMQFQTYWGNQTLYKYVIEMLPVLGDSLYLGASADDVDKTLDGYLADYKSFGNGVISDMKDTLLMYEILGKKHTAAPKQVITLASGVRPLDSWKQSWEWSGHDPAPERQIHNYNSKANMFWWINHFVNAGSTISGVLDADAIGAAAYNNGYSTSYTAYNPSDNEITVRFSDGASITVPPLGFASAVSPGTSGSGSSSKGGCFLSTWPE